MLPYGARELARAFHTVRDNTLQIVNELSEDKLDFAPADGARTIRQLLSHIAFGDEFANAVHKGRLGSVLELDFPTLVAQAAAEEAKPRDKAALVALLTERGKAFELWLSSLSDDFLAELVGMPPGRGARDQDPHRDDHGASRNTRCTTGASSCSYTAPAGPGAAVDPAAAGTDGRDGRRSHQEVGPVPPWRLPSRERRWRSSGRYSRTMFASGSVPARPTTRARDVGCARVGACSSASASTIGGTGSRFISTGMRLA